MWRLKNLAEGEEQMDILIAKDFHVERFSDYHFRINDRLDVWPSTKKWYDRLTMRKGEYNNLIEFVMDFFHYGRSDA